MNQAPTSKDLLAVLGQAEVALTSGDTDAANVAMAKAAEICWQMQGDGTAIPAPDLAPLQQLAERCGSSLTKLGKALNAESLREDNHRRGLQMYQASLRRQR